MSPAKASKNTANTELKKVHVASINIKAGLASNRREGTAASPQEPTDAGEPVDSAHAHTAKVSLRIPGQIAR
jgi:hypothetical protein